MENEHAANRTTLLRNARVILPDRVAERADVLIEMGRIARISEPSEAALPCAEATLNLDGLTLWPGFIDAHIHGSIGVDTMEATVDDLHRVSAFLARHGVTAWLPTLVPAPVADYKKATSAIAQLMREEEARPATARAVGVHYEGPFINSAQCGALRPAYFRAFASFADVDDLPPVEADGARHLMTIAPEIVGGIELITELRRRGWIVAIGHTRAEVPVLERALEAGARHMTHFMNAMSPLHHRSPGPVGWGLLRDDVTCDIIADGVHLDPLMLQLILRCKRPACLSLISDAVAPTGSGDGRYEIWGETIEVENGRTCNARGNIAGSVITMLDAVRMMLSLDVPLNDVARMAASNPAQLLGLDAECGSIEEGKRADLTALDAAGNVRLTLVGSRIACDNLQPSS